MHISTASFLKQERRFFISDEEGGEKQCQYSESKRTRTVVAEIAGLITDIKNYIPGIKATELACARSETGISVTVLGFIALVLVSGILKEIYFRGLAKRFCGPVFGEITALLLSNVLFAVFDWHNLGHSFIIGLVWIYAYKKTGHLITPMICHVGAGLYYVTYTVIALI